MTEADRPRSSFTRSLIGGTISGVAASAAMSGALALIARYEEETGGGESTTEKTADAISEALTGEDVARADREVAGKLVHYVTGAALGALYGVGSRWLPAVRAGWGTGYGVAVAAVLDEGIVPALGLAEGPTDVPLSAHVESGVGHLVFGIALETMTRVLMGRPED